MLGFVCSLTHFLAQFPQEMQDKQLHLKEWLRNVQETLSEVYGAKICGDDDGRPNMYRLWDPESRVQELNEALSKELSEFKKTAITWWCDQNVAEGLRIEYCMYGCIAMLESPKARRMPQKDVLLAWLTDLSGALMDRKTFPNEV